MGKISAFFLFLIMATAMVHAATISGDYLESRSADVYVAQCFANGEVGLVGDQAMLAWHIRQGSWQGQKLDGLTVVAAVKAKATLGDPYHNPLPAKSVLLVDDHATAAQRSALRDFAQHMGGELLANVSEVIPTTIEMQITPAAGATAIPDSAKAAQSGSPGAGDPETGDGSRHHHGLGGHALLRAGDIAAIETRSLSDKDHTCGNETTFYPPLTELSHSMPAVAVTDSYQGPGLGVSWSYSGKRSAFVGSFEQ